MMTCIRCQQSSDDGFQRVNAGLCPSCAQTVSTVLAASRRGHENDAHLPLELAIDR
jgi:hypothetical protein